MKLRHLVVGLSLVTASASVIGAEADEDQAESEFVDLLSTQISDLEVGLDTGRWTAKLTARAALDRVASLDRAGPALGSLIHVNDRAPDQAAELVATASRAPLFGVPMVIDDRCNTRDQPTSGGLAALRGRQSADDAVVVERLRAAGAIFIGKANTDGPFSSYGRVGYSSAGGATRNPYRPSRAGIGAGTAVAAGMALAAVGTDTVGALRAAAAGSALVGIRPTLGLTSRTGTMPLARSLDVTGVLARGVRDAALVLGVIAGPDEDDWLTRDSEPHQVGDYTLFLDADALEGARIGIARGYRGGNGEVGAAFERALNVLRAGGAELVDLDLPDILFEANDALIRPIAETELGDQLAAYLAAAGEGLPDTLAELVSVSRSPLILGSPTPEDPSRLAFWERAEASAGLADLRYLYLVSNRLPGARRIVGDLLKENELNAIVFPTLLCPPAPLLDAVETGDRCQVDDPRLPTYLASVTGFPELTLPMGYTSQGLPLGLSFLGRPYGEPAIIGIGYAFEQATGYWRAPDLTPLVDGQMSDLPTDAEEEP
jgi:amidase